MPLAIDSVQPGSLAFHAGIEAGDVITSINGMPIRDFLDLDFYASDLLLVFRIRDANGKLRTVNIIRDTMQSLGITPKQHVQRQCCNNCVFCFIDQMPPGMRPSLYIKDDDYLYSQHFGNYITLTNLGKPDLDRIIEQRITPLFISAHTTDPALRRRMMRHKRDFNLLKVLSFLAQKRISYHLQIVCVPGFNDGNALRKTIRDLLSPKLTTLSIGIVPVGLTRFRDGLPALQPFSPASAANLLDLVTDEAQKHKAYIVYAADEFYVLAGRDVPSAEYYMEYPQLENGIGMLRLTMEYFSCQKADLRRTMREKGGRFLILTSKAASRQMEEIAASLSRGRGGMPTRAQAVDNRFFGPLITVSGLLTYADITSQARPAEDESVLIPRNVFNTDMVTLDGYSPQHLKQELGRDILVVDSFFEYWYWI